MGIDNLPEADDRRLIDRAIVDGYERIRPTPEEDEVALRSTCESILEERW